MKAGILKTTAIVHMRGNAQVSVTAGWWGKRTEHGFEKYLSRRFI